MVDPVEDCLQVDEELTMHLPRVLGDRKSQALELVDMTNFVAHKAPGSCLKES